MPRNSPASCCNIGSFTALSSQNKNGLAEYFVIKLDSRPVETNIHLSLLLAFAHQCYVLSMHYHLAEQTVLVGVGSAFITKDPICSFSEHDSVETLTFY